MLTIINLLVQNNIISEKSRECVFSLVKQIEECIPLLIYDHDTNKLCSFEISKYNLKKIKSGWKSNIKFYMYEKTMEKYCLKLYKLTYSYHNFGSIFKILLNNSKNIDENSVESNIYCLTSCRCDGTFWNLTKYSEDVNYEDPRILVDYVILDDKDERNEEITFIFECIPEGSYI